jgi:hypothetical protein
MPGWQPIHENHAIDVMAAVITFAQPVPDVALRKMLRAAEDVAFSAGLRSRHSTQAMQLVIAPQGVSSTGPAGGLQGLMFNARFEGEEETSIPGRIAEQLQVDARSIIYRTWRYVSWSWQLERMRSLMTPAVTLAREVTAFATTRLEYLDRFWYDGDPREANTSELLRTDCPQLSPHIFGERDLWHVHTGAFLRSEPSKRLQQVLVDALDGAETQPAESPLRRWIHVTTALEDRFPTETALDDPRENADFPFQVFDEMHSELKDLLASIITAVFANRIYLTGHPT